MADPLGSAIVSGLVELILDKLGGPAFQEIGRLIGLEDELKRLGNTLSDIDAVLLDAEKQQITLHSVRNWLQSLKDAAGDIEDLLDLISTQDLEQKVNGKKGLIQKLSRLLTRHSLARKLKAICSRLDEIAINRSKYNFQETQQPSLETSRERETDSFVQESHIFGRDEDKEWIVTHFVSSSSSSQEAQQIPVLPIVGIGGMGKTTLAKLLLHDPSIGAIENFELKLWAYVPNKFDLNTVLCNIIQSATGESSSGLNADALKKRLSRILIARTFFLVLDNVWLEDPKEWMEMKELLDVGSKRSRIIVTTRQDRVASLTGTMDPFKLKPLSIDQCWSIFAKCAFREGEEQKYPSLVQIGNDIVQKCCGVPLAAKTLGSQLRFARDISTWRRIEESELWKMKQAPSDIFPALKLSFDQLPYHLCPCFSSCSKFIKGEFINQKDLILSWMALGLLQSKDQVNEGLELEEIGHMYFDELVSRSFFEPVHPFTYTVQKLSWCYNISETDMATKLDDIDPILGCEPSYNKIIGFQMHDLLYDLATCVAASDTASVSCDKHDLPTGVRYLVWKNEDLSERKFPHRFLGAKKARSLVFCHRKLSCMSKSFLQGLISHCKCLRVLLLSDFEFEYLPNSVGDLKHLRYLSLARNPKLMGLPNSICKLVNLQTLDVVLCDQLTKFPRDLHRLVSLRHLQFTSTLASFPKTDFHGWSFIQQIMIADCMDLRSIPGEIGTLHTLKTLQIICCPNLNSLPESICHLIALEELEIWDCEKLDLMAWEGLQGLRSIQRLDIQNLPLLVHFPKGFQASCEPLRYLIVKECRNLIALPECLQQCTSLLNLTLYDCTSLSSLPISIQAIETLQELWIAKCPLLSSRCEREIGEDWHLISHIPLIRVDHRII